MPVKISIYLDTSVINHLFALDRPDRMADTKEFFSDFVKPAVYETFISRVVVQEINNTASEENRQRLMNVIKDYSFAFADMTNLAEIDNLADLYIRHKIIPPSKRADALHIAISTINHIDFLVSWNFKHLANADREQKVLAVNYANNYLHPVKIVTPLHLMGAGN